MRSAISSLPPLSKQSVTLVAQHLCQTIEVSTSALAAELDHEPEIGTGQRSRREQACAADCRAEYRSFAVVARPGSFDIGVQVGLKLVMTGNLIDLSILFTKAKPPARFFCG